MTMTGLKISKTLLAVMLTSAVATVLLMQKTPRRIKRNPASKVRGRKSIAP